MKTLFLFLGVFAICFAALCVIKHPSPKISGLEKAKNWANQLNLPNYQIVCNEENKGTTYCLITYMDHIDGPKDVIVVCTEECRSE